VYLFSSFGIAFGATPQKKGNSRTLEFAWVPTMHPHLQTALTSKANLATLRFYCTVSWHHLGTSEVFPHLLGSFFKVPRVQHLSFSPRTSPVSSGHTASAYHYDNCAAQSLQPPPSAQQALPQKKAMLARSSAGAASNTSCRSVTPPTRCPAASPPPGCPGSATLLREPLLNLPAASQR